MGYSMHKDMEAENKGGGNTSALGLTWKRSWRGGWGQIMQGLDTYPLHHFPPANPLLMYTFP